MLATYRSKPDAEQIDYFVPSVSSAPKYPTENDENISKLKLKDITHKKKKKNFNPLLPEGTQLSDDVEEASTPSRMHSFTICTNTAKTIDVKASKFYNVYCMLFLSNIFLFGAFLLLLHNELFHVLSVLCIAIGLMLNVYTIWSFCGQRLCPRWFKHENKLVFDDNMMKLYIHWNDLLTQSSFSYDNFVSLYVTQTKSETYGIIFIATRVKHYRLNKYLCEIERAKEFVSTVNNWWNVDRLEEKKRIYNNRNVVAERNAVIQKKKQLQEMEEKPKTKEEIYLENWKSLDTMIKQLKYKSFSEKDIAAAFKLREFFESKYKTKMIEEYTNIKMDLKSKREEDGHELIFKNESQYIASALLLKFETLHQLVQKRKMQKLEIMIEENKRNKITFSDDEEDENNDQDGEKNVSEEDGL